MGAVSNKCEMDTIGSDSGIRTAGSNSERCAAAGNSGRRVVSRGNENGSERTENVRIRLHPRITVYDDHFTVEFKSGLETEVAM